MLSAPGLRAAAMENQIATQELILAALQRRDGVAPDLRTRVLVGASLGALTTAVTVWVESDGETELPALIDEALTALSA